tara:strand:+ start:294 stop:749 length:456 start_codon:yes stop_codon:yes gene_type:complete
MIWKTCNINIHIKEIKELFNQNKNHKHANNYLIKPLFEWTLFARLGFDPHLVYYSAAIERPEYNGSIRIMSRHTRSVNYNFGNLRDDLKRGLETLEILTEKSLEYGYDDIWVSREESPKLLEYFANESKYDWSVNKEKLHYGKYQYVLRKI